MSKNSWIVPIGQHHGRLKLFCLPYAGANSTVFHGWDAGLSNVDIYALEPPGRGRRIADEPISDMGQLIGDLMPYLEPLLDGPFAFFGHSLGGYIAHELAHACRERVGREPECLIVSASKPPADTGPDRVPEPCDDATILDALFRLGGTPAEILQHKALMRLLMPMLRADFSLARRYVTPQRKRLDCLVAVLAGLEDEACSPARLLAWKHATAGPFQHHVMAGGHFFLHERLQDVQALVGAIVSSAANGADRRRAISVG